MSSRAEIMATEIEAEARLDLYGYAGRRVNGILISCRIQGESVDWHISSRRITRESAVKLLRRYLDPRLTSIPGPLPAQVDFLDPRFRKAPGPTSDKIPFQRPGWVAQRDWDSFVKAATRESTYTVTVTVTATLSSLNRYIKHLQQERAAESLLSLVLAPIAPEAPEPPEEHVIFRGLSEKELNQHAVYRSMGIMPWIWTAQRGANIVLLDAHRREFALWQRARKAGRP